MDEQSPLGPSFGRSRAMLGDISEVAKPAKDGWDVARDIANWMGGQDRTRALNHINQMEAVYKEQANAETDN